MKAKIHFISFGVTNSLQIHFCATPNRFIKRTVTQAYSSTIQTVSLLCFHFNNANTNAPKKKFLDSWPLKMGPIGFLETWVRNCHYTLRNIPARMQIVPQCYLLHVLPTSFCSCDKPMTYLNTSCASKSNLWNVVSNISIVAMSVNIWLKHCTVRTVFLLLYAPSSSSTSCT
jgi:hypothetical protein